MPQIDKLNNLAELLSLIFENPRNDQFTNYQLNGDWVNISNREFCHKIFLLTEKLKSLGVKRNDRVAIFADSSPFWLMADFSCQLIGAVSVPMFTNISIENLKFQLQDCQAKHAFVIGSNKWQVIKKFKSQFKNIFTHQLRVKDPIIHSISEIFTSKVNFSKKLNFEKYSKNIKKNDLASIIYTSGSQGMPKGVMISHYNLISQIKDANSFFKLNKDDVALSFLPLAHIFERMVMSFYLARNIKIYFADDVNNVPDLLKDVKPTIITTVPRLLEKIYAKISLKLSSSSIIKKLIAGYAMKYAMQKEIGSMRIKFIENLFNKILYKKLLRIFGGKIRIMISGGAPLDKDIYRFFTNIGLPLYQGYGLTEASPVISTNCPRNHLFASSGKVFPSVKVKISKDGEILAKGPNIMLGYLNNLTETKNTIKSSWLKTGDRGEINKDGYLFITGRIKDLQKTSNGKYVATNLLTEKLKKIPLIENSVIIADGRKFVSAILFPDFASLKTKKINLRKFRKLLAKEIDEINKDLNHWEQIRKFHLAKTSPTIDNQELTPSMKLRPNFIIENYKKAIANMYKQ
tara:strand:- start:2788 stop:4509 length:1722 start_codon:yes stop_codon:yes gene_type:complete